MLFTIDCLPFDEKEIAKNQSKREDILLYIMSQSEVSVQGLHVAKTRELLHKDQIEIAELQTKIDGYRQQLKEEKAFDTTSKDQTRLTEIIAQKAKLKSQLDEKDSYKLITIDSYMDNR